METVQKEKKGERKTDATYKTVVIDYAPKAKKMAAAIEDKANEMARLRTALRSRSSPLRN